MLVDVACNCIIKQLLSELTHDVLQLCAILNQEHSGAISFFDAKGLPLLLNLPTSSVLYGNHKIAATIIQHVFKVSKTLQQVMKLDSGQVKL